MGKVSLGTLIFIGGLAIRTLRLIAKTAKATEKRL